MELEIRYTENPAGGMWAAYEKKSGTYVGKITYIRHDPQHITVDHTIVEPNFEGQGIAKQLVMAMISYAKEHKQKVVPLCSYVDAYFKRHVNVIADLIETERPCQV